MQLTSNGNKSCLCYLNKLVDEYNYSYHPSIGRKSTNVDYSALTEKIESSHSPPKSKVGV